MDKIAVWIGQDEAKVFHVNATTVDEATVLSERKHIHRHPEDDKTRTHNHPDDEHRFFRDVAGNLAGADEVLVVGPSVTKWRFLRYLQKSAPALDEHIVGVESSDHPTDRQLVAYVRHYFHRDPRRIGTDG